jgi:hypothetical protein
MHGTRGATRPSFVLVLVTASLLAAGPRSAVGQETPPAPINPKQALRALTGLQGTWIGLIIKDIIVSLSYSAVGGESTVIEVLERGGQRSMATVYTLVGADLIATHHCANGARTTMRLNPQTSVPDRFVFDFVALDNLDPKADPGQIYVRSMELQMPAEGDEGRLVYTQTHFQGTQELGAYTTELARQPLPRHPGTGPQGSERSR